MLRKEWLMMFLVSLLTLLAAVWLVRWLAPGLLGMPVDMRLVSSSDEAPSFYDNIFRTMEPDGGEFLLRDPGVVNRARPLFPDVNVMGPNDVLGFRNRDVPNVADIVAIGDSQTYGNNAPLEQNWPSHLQQILGKDRPLRVYNISVGAWSAIHYLEIMKFALRLRPRIVIVGMYTGNDPLLDFSSAYGSDRWARFRPDPSLEASDAPRIAYPPPDDELWFASLADGSRIGFTPAYRYVPNNRTEPAVRAGYRIMARVASEMRDLATSAGALPVFTIIPTKELVYSERLAAEGVGFDPVYRELVRDEMSNIEELAADLASLDGARYADLVAPLKAAALSDADIYPRGANGHPAAAGYRQIALALAEQIAPHLPPPLRGLYGVQNRDGSAVSVYLVTDKGKWIVPDPSIAYANGWGSGNDIQMATVVERDMTAIPTLGVLNAVDPERFGPGAFK
ncbi:MAG: hypothetical protein DWQ08_08510 [Proteobacteria bacterium]|nr:MAG: hypothetical protein DWQ08_08510 [Pseudomonadota bacterium]